MKFKKLLISASAVAAGSGLLATVLTSCAKSNIDDDLKIKLDDDGKFIDELQIGTADFKAAAQKALKQSSTWKIFKENLAKEIIYKWYVNRAASKDHPNRNSDFKTFLQRKNYKIDDDYNTKVDSYKSKYGANHPFYVQNELLSPNGGTIEAYKHAQLVDMIKDEFIDNVFNTSYFSMKDAESTSVPGEKYPHIFSDAESTSITVETLNNPDNWHRIGFWARSNKNFTVKPEDDVDELAANPDGDYAIIQNYVFNRWFETEKPFFSAAALFKYNKPATVGSAMTDLYSNKTTVPDTPNEAFPFFGTAAESPSSNGYTGQRAFWHWYKDLKNGVFSREGLYKKDSAQHWNYTTSIPLDCSEDKQTLLLCYANNMIAGSSGTLYTPYAVSAANLYNQMFLVQGVTPVYPLLNTLEPTVLDSIIDLAKEPKPDQEDPMILKLFFYNDTPASTIKSYLDLNNVYGGLNNGIYHCPLFKENKLFTFFYGDTTPDSEDANGVRYITNNIQINGLKPETAKAVEESADQHWIFELNESGMHAQTIDGYQYVRNAIDNTTQTAQKYKRGRDALKQVLMYRLLQHKIGWDDGITSANVFGSKSGDLYDYFKNNFADIVLEIALSQKQELNVFRDIETYEAGVEVTDDTKLFFTQVCEGKDSQKLGDWENVAQYIKVTRDADIKKSIFDNIVNSDKKIYAYRSTQVSNSKNDVGSNKVFENGLLAPIATRHVNTQVANYETMHHYFDIVALMKHPLYFGVDSTDADVPTINSVYYNKSEIVTAFADATFNIPFINDIASVTKDSSSSGFSARIAKAKQAQSNRYWYESWIVDKTMYSFLDSNSLANEIKWNTYDLYINDDETFKDDNYKIANILTGADDEITSAYKAKKVLTSDNNFANLAASSTTDFYTTISAAYERLVATNKINSGEFNDDYLSFKLFQITMGYLAKNNFERFYNALEDTIKDGERAYVAYLTKYNTYDPFEEISNDPSTLTNNPYLWTADAANIYDYWNYTGNTAQTSTTAAPKLRGDFDSYWNVISKRFNGTAPTTAQLGGFLGIQTPSKNELDSDSGLSGAAFGNGSKPFSHHVYKTKTVDTGVEVAENAGVWYPWAGVGLGEGEANEYYFKPIKVGDEPEIGFNDISPIAHKLAHKFVTYSNTEDLRTLAGKVGKELHNQDNIFNKISTGEQRYDDPDTALIEMKYDILEEFKDNKTFYETAFQRLQNVELRKGMYDGFCFENQKNEGFKLMVTQINMADVHEKHMTPTFNGTTWSMDSTNAITLNEFWYILCTFANDSKYQQDAMKDAIKQVFNGKKLVVHDALLYNKFDSTWIKDWVKKPMGE